MDIFQEAYRRAVERIGDHNWHNMTSREQSDHIFQEMRVLDAEHAATDKPASQETDTQAAA